MKYIANNQSKYSKCSNGLCLLYSNEIKAREQLLREVISCKSNFDRVKK